MSKRSILAIFILALALRLAFVGLVAGQQTSSTLLGLFPDSQRYVSSARLVLGQTAGGEEGLFFSGPGYAVFLAGIFRLFGVSAWPVLVVQALLSSLGCVLVMLCGRLALPDATAIPFLAGLIAAGSLTAISLSATVLTETLFFTVQAAALYCLLCGLARNRQPYFFAGGILAGVAVLTRAAAQFWAPAMFLALALAAATRAVRLSRGLLLKAAAGLLLVLAIVAGWSGRNAVVHGQWTLAAVGPYTARVYWTAATLASVNGTDVATERGGESMAPGRDDSHVVLAALRHYPWPMARTYLATAVGNLTATSSLQCEQLPAYRDLCDDHQWRGLLRAVGLLLLGLSLVGLVTMVRRSPEALLLAVTYGYFILISGFTFWQGSRIVYPAQMAGAIFAAAGAAVLAGAGKRVLRGTAP